MDHYRTGAEQCFERGERDEPKVYVKTILAYIPWKIDREAFFARAAITELPGVPERARKAAVCEAASALPEGSIVAVQRKQEVRGYVVKHRRKSAKGRSFPNVVSVYMVVCRKLVNFKMPGTGNIQITGCNQEEQAFQVVRHLKRHCDQAGCVDYAGTEDVPIGVLTVMNNNVGCLGYHVDRDMLAVAINSRDSQRFTAVFAPGTGYAGCMISTYLESVPEEFRVPSLRWGGSGWESNELSWDEYVQTLPEKKRQQHAKKQDKKNTWLVFETGKVIHVCPYVCSMARFQEEYVAMMRSIKIHVLETIKYSERVEALCRSVCLAAADAPAALPLLQELGETLWYDKGGSELFCSVLGALKNPNDAQRFLDTREDLRFLFEESASRLQEALDAVASGDSADFVESLGKDLRESRVEMARAELELEEEAKLPSRRRNITKARVARKAASKRFLPVAEGKGRAEGATRDELMEELRLVLALLWENAEDVGQMLDRA